MQKANASWSPRTRHGPTRGSQLADNRGAWTVTISTDNDTTIGTTIDGAHPLEYSMWSRCTGEGTTDAVFLAGGQIELADVDCRNARWKLDGDRVSFTCGRAAYVATLSGDKLDGTWTDGARKGTLCLRRADPSSNPNAKKVAPSAKQVGKKRANRGTDRNERNDKTNKSDKPKVSASAVCRYNEHKFEGGCYTCPPNFRWRGDGTCLENCPGGWIEWQDQCVQCPAGSTWNRNGSCYEWRITSR